MATVARRRPDRGIATLVPSAPRKGRWEAQKTNFGLGPDTEADEGAVPGEQRRYPLSVVAR